MRGWLFWLLCNVCAVATVLPLIYFYHRIHEPIGIYAIVVGVVLAVLGNALHFATERRL